MARLNRSTYPPGTAPPVSTSTSARCSLSTAMTPRDVASSGSTNPPALPTATTFFTHGPRARRLAHPAGVPDRDDVLPPRPLVPTGDKFHDPRRPDAGVLRVG